MKKSSWLLIGLLVGLIFLTRFWRLDSLPPSPYEEEVALGYEAFSLWKTGKDHHGNEWPLLALQSFGDWKPALYAYSIIPFLPIFDLSVLAVRLPSALAGICIIISLISLARFLKFNWRWTALAAITSPWLIMFSRAAWEANLATALITAAVALYFSQTRWTKPSRRALAVVLAALLLGASAYTYHSARVIVPLLVMGITVWSLWPFDFSVKSLLKRIASVDGKLSLLHAVFAFLCVLPLLMFARQPMIAQRALETSFIGTPELVAQAIAQDIHPYVLYAREFTKNYLLHLDPRFLFVNGDINPRHTSQQTALFYWFDIVVLALGAALVFRKLSKSNVFLLFWLAISLVPVAITKDVPHALRILPAAPVFMLLLGLGYAHAARLLGSRFKRNQIGVFIMAVIMGMQFFFFWHYYVNVYPKQWSAVWQYGLEEVMAKTDEYVTAHSERDVYFYRTINRPLMYYWFYNKTNPEEVQAIAQDFPGEVQRFGRLHIGEPESSPALYVHRGAAEQPSGAVLWHTVTYLNGEPAWKLYER